MSLPVMLSMGMGVDSSALLARWLLDPSARDFDLDDLVVVTAMTGDEYARTGELMQQYMLPLMAAQGVRYVQLARAGQSDDCGYEVLSDSRRTSRMVMQGSRWRLRDEQQANGVVPQVASGRRWCSYRAKGQVLDWWVADEFAGGEYRHVVGFAAEEVKRSVRDTSYTSAARHPWYPLIEWGWDRESCLAYLRDTFGVAWSRSCCGYCPFQAGREMELLCERWRRDPAAAALALQLEVTAVAINPRSLLFNSRSARRVAIHAGLRHLVDQVDAEMAAQPWAVFDVRRAFPARKLNKDGPSVPANWDPYAKGKAPRYLQTLAVESCAEARALLVDQGGRPEGEHGLVRVWKHRAGPPYPSREQFLVAAPVGPVDKVGRGFHTVWANAQAAPGAELQPSQDVWERLIAVAVGL
ncbi:hypothetical protein [Micromonospora sp. C51]|uniref:hypothetical protein n=1 Tax=Micromonospora sp. C51 TaxID=2824879 RepID=UPI001FFDB7AF|nr:hypothetical protein [Micromonospora sp. C51]